MLSLVTDRTQADVSAHNEKGTYNSTDLNRVNSAMEYLSKELSNYGYKADLLSVPVWAENDIPTVNDMEIYLKNISTLREVLNLATDTPKVPESMNYLTYQKANDIEKILIAIETSISRVVKSMSRCNAFTFWSGNRPLPSAESNLGRTWKELDAMNTTWRNWQVADWYLLLYGNLKAEGDVM